MKKVLIATLGDSPPVITEAIDKLHSQGIELDEVVLLTTKDADAQDSAELLQQHIYKYYQGRLYVSYLSIPAYEDIKTPEEVVEFLREACEQLKRYLSYREPWEIYVSIAGGRKAMSAMMTLAVQFYGATSLFHIIVEDPDIEEQSHIKRLKHNPNREAILHPDLNKVTMVHIPILGLFPWINDILNALRGHPIPEPKIKEILERHGLISQGRTTTLGRMILEVLEEVENAPSPRETPPKLPPQIEPPHKTVIEKISHFYFVTEIAYIRWREGQPLVRIDEEGNVEINFHSRRCPRLALKLATTAKTEGQCQWVKKHLESFLSSL